MNKSILHSAITAAIAISITACSSGGSDVAGIGGSGITPTGGVISSGTITGFGSIFVNGVEFETSSSIFSVDDNPGTESDLAIGMRVIVDGTVNADGVSGTATSVSFDDQLQGPVGTVSNIDADGTGKTITVLGTTVALNSTSTIFDVSGTGGGNFSFDNIRTGNNVEISAFPDSTGVLKATRVELKDATFVANSSIVELKGTIANLDVDGLGTFDINGVNVETLSVPATLDDLPGGVLAEGTPVEVKGTCADTSCDPINATRVEGQTLGFDDSAKIEVEGVITRYNSDSDFDVDGFPVDASSTSVQRIPPTLTLGIDREVEVEGTVVSGRLIATKVKDEGGNVKVAATVTSVNSAAGSFELTPVSGQSAITVMIDTSTQIEDEIGDFNSAALLDNLSIGTDYVSIEGYDDGTGRIIASEVEREASDDVILQGIITAGSTIAGSVTVLGVTIPFDADTEFENENDDEFVDADAFFNAIGADGIGTTLIKVKDKEAGGGGSNDVGTADEIEIELP